MFSAEDTSADAKRVPTRNVNAIRNGIDPTRNLSAADTVQIQTMEVPQCQNVMHHPTPTELNGTQNTTTSSVSLQTGGKFTAKIVPVRRSSTDPDASNVMPSQQREYYPSHNSSTMILPIPTKPARENCDKMNRVATIGTLEESHTTDKRNIVNKAYNATQSIYGGGVTHCSPATKNTARVIKVKHESPVEPAEQATLPKAVTGSYPVPENHATCIHPVVKTTISITLSHNNQTIPQHTSVAHMEAVTTCSTHGRIIIPHKHVKYKSSLPNKEDVNKFVYFQTSFNVLPANTTATKPKYTTTKKPSVSPLNCNPSSASSGNTRLVGSLNTERNVIVRLPRPEDVALANRAPHCVHIQNSESPEIRVSLNNALNADGVLQCSTLANCIQLSPNSVHTASLRSVDYNTVTKGNAIVQVDSSKTGPYSPILQRPLSTTFNTVGLVQSNVQSSLLTKKQNSDHVNNVITQYHYSPTRTTATKSLGSVQTSCVSSTVTEIRPLIRGSFIPHLTSSGISPTIPSRGIPSTVQPKRQIIPTSMHLYNMSLTTTSLSTPSAIQLTSHVKSSTVKPQSILSAVQHAPNNIPSAVQLRSHSIPSVLQPVSLDIPPAMQLTSTGIPVKGMSKSIPSAVQFAPQNLSIGLQPTATSHSIQSAVQHVSQSSAVQIMSHGIQRKNVRHSIPSVVQNISQGIMSRKQSMPQSIQSNKPQCTPLLKKSRAIEYVLPDVSLHRYVNSKGVIFPIYNQKRPDSHEKCDKEIESVLEKGDSLTSRTTRAYPLFALSNESSDERQWSKYLKVGDVSVMDDVCEHENVPSHRTLSSDTEVICKVFDEDLNKSTSATDKPVLLHSKKMFRNTESLQKSFQKENPPCFEKKMNFLQPYEQGCVDMSWYSEMSKLLKEFETNKVTVPEYVTVQNERYVINCLDSRTSDNDPENTGYANSKRPGQRDCEEDIPDGAALIRRIVNLNEKKVLMNSGIGVQCSSVIGNKRRTTHMVPFASTNSTNAGCIPDRDPDVNSPCRVLDDVEPNLTQEMVDNDRPTPVLLIPNLHFVSSQHEVNEVNDISDPFEVSSYLGDPLTRNSGTENSVLDHDRVQCEQLSEIVSSSPGVNVKSKHADTISPYAVTQELVSVIKQEEETEMLNNTSILPTTQLISPREVKMEPMVHDSDGENGNVEPIFYDDRNLSDVSIPNFKIKKEPLDIYTPLNKNGSEIAQQSLIVGNLDGDNHAIKREPPDSICSVFPSDIEHSAIIDNSTQSSYNCVVEIQSHQQSRQQDILRTDTTDHTSARVKIDRLSECSNIDLEIQEQKKEMLQHHLKRKADQLHYSNKKFKISTPFDKTDRNTNDEGRQKHNIDTEDIVHKHFKISRNVSELLEKPKLDTENSSNKTLKIYSPVSKSEMNKIHDSSTWDVLNNTLLPTPVLQLDVFDEKRNVIGKTVPADFYDETDGNIPSSFVKSVVILGDSNVGVLAKTNVGSTCSGKFSDAYDQSVRKTCTENCDISSNTNTISFSESSTSGTAANEDGCVRQSLNITACITPNSWEHSYSIQPVTIITYHGCSTRSGNNVSRPKRNEHFPYGLTKSNTKLSRNTSTSLSSSNNDSLITDNNLKSKKKESQCNSGKPLYKCIQKEHTYSVDDRPTSSNIHVGSDLDVQSSYGVSSKYVECQTDAGDYRPTSSNIQVGSDLDVQSSYGVSSKSVECQTDAGDYRPTSSNSHAGSDLNVKSSSGVSSKSVECQTDTGERGWISLL